MISIVLYLVAILSAGAACAVLEAGTLSNARYLGMAYKALAGNPDRDISDPGFALRGVLEFTWDNASTTSDGNYTLPDLLSVIDS